MKPKNYLFVLLLVIGIIIISGLSLVSAVWWNPFTWFNNDDIEHSPIGYEFMHDNSVVHIWNTQDHYYFEKDSGIQFTNHYQDYWSENVFCIGYYNAQNVFNEIKCADDLTGFTKSIETDEQTYVNATLWKDITYNGYDLRLGVKYSLKLDDENLTIEVYGKNIGVDIPFKLGFAWQVKNISIPDSNGKTQPYGDSIEINDTRYNLTGTYDLTFKDMKKTYTNYTFYPNGTEIDNGEVTEYLSKLRFQDWTEHLQIDWKHNLDYEVQMWGNGIQEDFSVQLIINAGYFNAGQEKSTEFKWIDAEGDYIEKWTASQTTGLWGLATYGDNLYAVQDGRVVNIYDKTGTYQSQQHAAMDTGDGFATNGTSTWTGKAADNKIYEELLSNGNAVTSWAGGLAGDGDPAGIDTDGTNIWIMRASTGEVRKFDMSGTYVSTFTLANADQHWRFTIWEGYLYAPRVSDSKLYKYDLSDGSVVNSWDLNVGQRVAYIRSMTTDGEYIWVGDYDNREVYVYEANSGDSTAPIVTLGTPTNETELNTNSISQDFTCKATDEINLDNITFQIWNQSTNILLYSSTNTDGDNNTLETFTYTVTGGTNYSWNCLAYDNSSNSASATNNNTVFVYSIPDNAPNIEIGLSSPANNDKYLFPMLVTFNASNVYDDFNLQNVTLWINKNGAGYVLNQSNTTGINNTNYLFSLIPFGDGVYYWYLGATDNASQTSTTTPRNFSIDSIFPQLNILSPLTDYGTLIVGQSLDFNATATDTNLQACWYDYNFTNTTYTCNTNITFTYTGQNNITFYANDSFGNTNNTVRVWTYDFVEAGESYNLNVLETSSQEFQFNITTLTTVLQILSFLHYNGEVYPASSICSGITCSQEVTIDVPLVTSGASDNNSFFWELKLFDGSGTTSYNSTTKYQTVSRVYLEQCNATYTSETLNFTAYDEENREQLEYWNFYAGFNFWLGSGEVKQNNTFDLENVTSDLTLCISPANYTYKLDGDIRYYKNDTNTTYKTRNYYFDNASITNTSQDIFLYLLDQDKATTFILQVLDQTSTAVENAYIYIQRCYEETGGCNTVQIVRTDASGKSVGFYEVETVDYKHIITLNGVVELDQAKAKVFPESTPYTLIFRIGDALAYPFKVLENNPNLAVSLYFNESNNLTTFSWVDSSGTAQTGTLNIYEFNYNRTNDLICTSTAAFSSATVTCNLTGYKGAFVAYALIDGEILDILRFNINNFKDTFGQNGILIGWFIIITVTLLFIWNPTAMIVAHNLAVILVGMIGFIVFSPIYIFSMIGVSIIAIILMRT